MNLKYQSGFGVVAIITIIAVLGLGGWYVATRDNTNDEVACTLEAKICPDGSAVGRVGPDCQFAPCPGENLMADVESGAMMEDGEAMMGNGETIMRDGENTLVDYQGQVLAGQQAPLLDFNQSDYEVALKTNKLIVLYFYANWCPTCKAEQPHLFGAFDELETDQVIGFRVNYKDNKTDDNEEALAREFGVAYQHTKVFIINGERIGKFPDSWNKARYLNEITNTFSN